MLNDIIQIPGQGIRTSAVALPPDDTNEKNVYVFEYFESEVELDDIDGTRTFPGDVWILYRPGQHKVSKTLHPSCRTWFHLKGEGLEECLRRYSIPTNCVMAGTLDPSTLATFLECVRHHAALQEPYWDHAVTVLARAFFRNLARSIALGAPRDLPSLYQRENLAMLRQVRAEIHSKLNRRWTIEDMAALSHLSSSYYRTIFTRSFNVSPIEDLTRARIRRAKLLLRTSKLSVKEISEQCGFGNMSQFYVYFRERTGQSPGEFIKSDQRTSHSGRTRAQDREAIDEVSLLYLEPSGCWRFDTEDGGADQDYHYRYPKLQFSHGASIGTGPNGAGALLLEGSHAHAKLNAQVINTQESYTISAWVLADIPAVPTDWMTAVSMGNESHCSFYLQYCLSEPCFMFTVTPSPTNYDTIHVRGVLEPETGKWFHLVGVHDREQQKVMLWENGVLSAELPYDTSWRASGPLRFGASVFWGILTDLWYGRLAEVRIYNRALSDLEIKTIYYHLEKHDPGTINP